MGRGVFTCGVWQRREDGGSRKAGVHPVPLVFAPKSLCAAGRRVPGGQSVAKSPRKYILTLSSDPTQVTAAYPTEGGPSIPDAWVLGPENAYCILIEAKVGDNPLNDAQVNAHAEGWLGLHNSTEREEAKRSASWELVCDTLADLVEVPDSTDASSLEKELISELLEYLRFFGYRSFGGLARTPLAVPPAFSLRAGKAAEVLRPAKDLMLPPKFNLSTQEKP